MRVVFAGSPAFALPSLQSLHQCPWLELVAVYTQPDRIAGRGQKLRQSAVKSFALANGLSVEQPTSWKMPETIARFEAYRPDILLVAAYGVILPEAALRAPVLGALNVHASLLPRWRGAAPIQRALMAGDKLTGVTIMQVVPALDAGPILHRAEYAITAQDTAGSVTDQLASIGAAALLGVLERLRDGPLAGHPQNEQDATYATKITRADRELDWTRPAVALERQTRALCPAPLAFTETLGLPVNVLECTVGAQETSEPPGTILKLDPAGIDIATGEGVLRILMIQPLGKRPMAVKDFLNGYGQRVTSGH
jgi:methionyl-tRNA formyltransferase